MTISPYAAITSVMLDQGWTQLDSGEKGSIFAKGDARTPVPYSLRSGSLAWRNILLAVAQVEREQVETMSDRVRRLLDSEPTVPAAVAERAELDLHLEGPGVRAHETAAYDYGRFVTRLAEVVKDLAKDATGVERHPRELQIVGGAQAGSVEVLVREPEERRVDEQGSLLDGPIASPERRALLALVQIMNASEEAASAPASSVLASHLDLSPSSRRSLARLASIMYQSGWIARGHLVAPAQDAVPVTLTLAGALRLQTSASDAQQRTTSETLHGQLDGWLWSTATMQFIPDDRASIRAAVPMVLQTAVAKLNSSETREATATFQVLERQAPNGGAISRTYALASLTPDEHPATLPEGPD